jgi:hypothetical protein
MPASPQWCFDRFRLDPDHAYWVSDLRVRDATAVGEVDVRTFGLGVGEPDLTPLRAGSGVLTGGDLFPALPYTFETRDRTAAPAEARELSTAAAALVDDADIGSEESADLAYRALVDQILNAASIEEVICPPEAIGIDTLARRQIAVFGWTVNESDYDAGTPFYVAIHAAIVESGEKVVVTCGSQRVMAQLIRIWMLDQMRLGADEADIRAQGMPRHSHLDEPIEVWVRQAKRPNRHGTLPLWLDARAPDTWR